MHPTLQGVSVITWVLACEVAPPQWRLRAMLGAMAAEPLGVVLAAAAALALQHWRGIQLALALPMLTSLAYIWSVIQLAYSLAIIVCINRIIQTSSTLTVRRLKISFGRNSCLH